MKFALTYLLIHSFILFSVLQLTLLPAQDSENIFYRLKPWSSLVSIATLAILASSLITSPIFENSYLQ